MNNVEVARICQQVSAQVQKISPSSAEFYNNMALLIGSLLSINVRSLEVDVGTDIVRKWLSMISEVLSDSLKEAYHPPSTLSVSIVVAEKLPEL